MWPTIVTCVFVLTTGPLLWKKPESERFELRGVARPLSLAALLLLFIPVYDVVGFLVPAALIMLFQLKVLGGERWPIAIAIAVTGTAATYLLFSELLGVNLAPL
jgi:putative tricarboxylic transport membrane protein